MSTDRTPPLTEQITALAAEVRRLTEQVQMLVQRELAAAEIYRAGWEDARPPRSAPSRPARGLRVLTAGES